MAGPHPSQTHLGNKAPVGDKWTPECGVVLDDLKDEVLAEPILARPDFRCRFYLKTDWSSDGMGAVLLQAADNDDAKAADACEDQ